MKRYDYNKNIKKGVGNIRMKNKFTFLLIFTLLSILLVACDNNEKNIDDGNNKAKDINNEEINVVLGEPEGIYLDDNGLLVSDDFGTTKVSIEKNMSIEKFTQSNDNLKDSFVRFKSSETTEVINYNIGFEKLVSFNFINGVLSNVSYLSYIKDNRELEKYEKDMNKLIVKSNLNEGSNYKQYTWSDEKSNLNFAYVINEVDENIKKSEKSKEEKESKDEKEPKDKKDLSSGTVEPSKTFNIADYNYVVLYSVFYDNFPKEKNNK